MPSSEPSASSSLLVAAASSAAASARSCHIAASSSACPQRSHEFMLRCASPKQLEQSHRAHLREVLLAVEPRRRGLAAKLRQLRLGDGFVRLRLHRAPPPALHRCLRRGHDRRRLHGALRRLPRDAQLIVQLLHARRQLGHLRLVLLQRAVLRRCGRRLGALELSPGVVSLLLRQRRRRPHLRQLPLQRGAHLLLPLAALPPGRAQLLRRRPLHLHRRTPRRLALLQLQRQRLSLALHRRQSLLRRLPGALLRRVLEVKLVVSQLPLTRLFRIATRRVLRHAQAVPQPGALGSGLGLHRAGRSCALVQLCSRSVGDGPRLRKLRP